MKQVVYTGPFDRRDLSEADLTRLGVGSPRDYTFTKGGIQEISNELGELLVESTHFLSEFRYADEAELKQQELDAKAEALANPQSLEDSVDSPEALAAAGGHVQGATSASPPSGKRASTADQA